MEKLINWVKCHPLLNKIYQFTGFVSSRIEAAQLKQVASSLTLTTLLSVVPALAVIMAAFTAFPLFAPYRESFEQFLFSTLLPEQYSAQIIAYIKDFATKAAGLTIFGVIGLAVSALLCIATIDSALNDTFQVKSLRKLWQRFLMYWALLTLGPIVISISLAASSYITGMAMTGHLSEVAGFLIPVAQFALQGIALSALYKFVPNCRVLWKDALIGGYIIALVFTVFRWAFGIYVLRGSYTTIYGAFAAIPVLLTWMYINWMFVLAGAAITATLPILRARRYADFKKNGNDLLSAVALLQILMKAKQNQTPMVSDTQLAKGIGSYPGAVDEILHRLAQRQYVVKTSEDTAPTWALLADAHTRSLEGVFEEFSLDLSNSLLSENPDEAAWIKECLSEQWLQKPMAEVLHTA